MENAAPQSKGGTNKILIVLLLVSLGLNAYLFTSKNNIQEEAKTEKDSLITARIDVEKELNETYTELNQYKGENARMDSLIAAANIDIDKYKERIAALIKKEGNSTALNKKLKAELEELKGLRDKYLEQIDALMVENEQLKKDKSDLTSKVENLSQNLEQTVSTASVLRAEYVKVKSYKKRSNDKYTETAMAKRTNKLETCFTVLENKIAKSGSKTVYLRILEPSGKVLGNRAEGSSTFKKNGSSEELLFTASQQIDYDNKNQDLCINWEEAERNFAPGKYIMEIYVDGNLSGSSEINLR
jgi:DNA repair exonuclease SbcCD ATPase subunit